jgi:AcrR family transcriptional regulator
MSVTSATGGAAHPTPGTTLWWQQRYLQEARRRPRSDGLTIDRITTAALAIIDAEGLEALTMRRLAADLGAGAASLYRHVATREELLVHVMDEVLGEIDGPPESATWQEGAREMAQAFRRIFSVHPELVHLLPNERMLGPNAMRGRELGLRGLMDWGFTPEAAIAIYVGIVTWVLGQTIVDRFVDERVNDAPRHRVYEALDLGEYPTVRETATTSPEGGNAGLFEAGLAALLDGLEARFPLGRPAR